MSIALAFALILVGIVIGVVIGFLWVANQFFKGW